MDNSVISDVRTTAYKEGVDQGMEIARKMLCDALKVEQESLGKAVAEARLMRIELDKYEKTTRD